MYTKNSVTNSSRSGNTSTDARAGPRAVSQSCPLTRISKHATTFSISVQTQRSTQLDKITFEAIPSSQKCYGSVAPSSPPSIMMTPLSPTNHCHHTTKFHSSKHQPRHNTSHSPCTVHAPRRPQHIHHDHKFYDQETHGTTSQFLPSSVSSLSIPSAISYEPIPHASPKPSRHSSSSFSSQLSKSKTKDYSLLVIFTLTIVAEAARGLLLPTLWPNYELFGGSKPGYGFLVAVYSLGRMVSVVPFGHLCDGSRMSASTALILTSLLQALGHLWYAAARSPGALCLSRALVGFGSASTSIARAHVTNTVETSRRTTVLAYLSGTQFVGFAVLPALGGVLSHATPPATSGALLNEYTTPAWILVAANLACAVFVSVAYRDPPQKSSSKKKDLGVVSDSESDSDAESESYNDSSDSFLPRSASYESSSTVTSSSSVSPGESSPLLSPSSSSGHLFNDTEEDSIEVVVETPPQAVEEEERPDYTAVFICLCLNLVFRGVLAQLEAISIPFLVEQYVLSYTFASKLMTLLGVLGAALYFSFRPLATLFSDRFLIAVGLGMVLFGCAPLSIAGVSNALPIAAYLMFLGAAWSVAYPIGQTAVLALFSKTLDGLGVASFMGVFSASGALSPLIVSVVATALWETKGRQAVFAFMGSTVIIAIILLVATYSRLGAKCKHRRQPRSARL